MRLLCMLMLMLILASTLAPAPPVYFSARWDSATSATIQWTQQQRGCLSVLHATGEQVFIGCYERAPATFFIELDHGSTDGTARPQAGDVYILDTGGEIYRAPLRARAQYFPAFY